MEDDIPEFSDLLAKHMRMEMRIPAPELGVVYIEVDKLKKQITDAIGINLFTGSLCYRRIDSKEKLKLFLFSPNFAIEEAERIAEAIKTRLGIDIECKQMYT